MEGSSQESPPAKSPDITAASTSDAANVQQVQDGVRATVPSHTALPRLHHISGTFSEPDTPDKYYNYYPAPSIEHDNDSTHLHPHMAKKPKVAHGLDHEERPASGVPIANPGTTQPPFAQPAGSFPSGQIPFQSLPPFSNQFTLNQPLGFNFANPSQSMTTFHSI